MTNSVPHIPELITVHLGQPDESAIDITIPFPDYIMNVASSSLNPNWPESVLRANIYYITSQALSRVHNKFYRRMGHDYDITSSEVPGYQYVDGHVIFENIRSLAGNTYNNYISRRGTLEPVGEADVENINKSGAFNLAGQGQNHLEILKSTYGENIDIVLNAPIENPNLTPPVFPIKFDDSGNDVRNLQIQLNRISASYPTIPKIAYTDGIFSYDTEAAVEEFQRIFGLPVTGVVDQATWYTISIIHLAINKLNSLSSGGVMLDMSAQQFPGNLSPGSAGNAVRALQYYINFLSMYYRLVPPVTIDGQFDSRTLAAVVDMQRTLGLNPTGVVDQETWMRMYDAYLGITRALSPHYYDGGALPYSGTELRLGAEGEQVRILQGYINYIAAIYPEIPNVSTTGYFGIKLQEAVVAAQKLLGIPYTGVVDENTWNAIAGLYTDLYKGAELHEGQYPGFDLDVETTGHSGSSSAVKHVQKCLHELSQRNDGIPPVVIDGIFDISTKESVTSFQENMGLDPTGTVDRETWDLLFEAYKNEQKKSLPHTSLSVFPKNPHGYVLSPGDAGFLVSIIQFLLQELSRDFDFDPPVVITGIFDEATEAAVRSFQEKNMMETTGVVCADTWNLLVAYYNIIHNEYSQ